MKTLLKNRPRYLRLLIPHCELDGREFVVVKRDYTKKIIRDLARWDSALDRQFILSIKDSLTGDIRHHSLTDIKKMESHFILIWNPHDAIDVVLNMLPSIVASTIMAGALSWLGGKAKLTNKPQEELPPTEPPQETEEVNNG